MKNQSDKLIGVIICIEPYSFCREGPPVNSKQEDVYKK